MPGYDWVGWSFLFYFMGGVFAGLVASGPEELGLTPIVYKWVVLVAGAALGATGKMGKSWVKKSEL